MVTTLWRAAGAAAAAAAAVLAAGGCAADGDDGSGGPGERALRWEQTFSGIRVAPGSEAQDLCASWRLGNDEPIWVNRVTMEAGLGWHHSNWFYVPEGTFAVEDGVWECAGEFDTLTAALEGGVLFAQSTQARDESQGFLPGAALEVPPGSVVVGQLHIINAGDRELETELSLTIEGIPADEVTTRLRPLALDFHQLAIPPQQRSRFETVCDMAEAWGGPLDMSVYYVLPHYHQYGLSMNVEMAGGERDGEPIYQVESAIGEPLGRSMSPPVPLNGASGIRFSCDFDNSTERTVGFGNNGYSEMCIMLAFTDSPATWGGGVLQGEPTLRGVEDGVAVYEGACQVISLLR